MPFSIVLSYLGERATHWSWRAAIPLVSLAACTRNLTFSASPVLGPESLLAILGFPFHATSLHACTARVLLTELRSFLFEFYETLVNIKTPWTVSLGGKKEEEKNSSSKILKITIASVFKDISSALMIFKLVYGIFFQTSKSYWYSFWSVLYCTWDKVLNYKILMLPFPI